MKISDDVIEIIEQGKVEDTNFFLPDIQLERQLYMKVNKVLTLLGGKWNRKTKSHVFVKNIENLIDNTILSGEIVDIMKELQYFYTPPNIVSQLIKLADIKSTDRVMEPSAGTGSISKELNELCKLDVCEVHPEFRDILKEQNMNIVGTDFLEYNPPFKYDKIVANPPFTRQQDITHVNHMLDICSGRIVSVMSAFVLFRENKRTVEFRERINDLNGEFIELPEGAFKESGTMVRTCIVVVDNI